MKTIRQTATIRGATPHDIYETIMDSKKHTKLAGSRTTVSQRVGGAFRVGRDLEGTSLRLVKDKKIVQSWRETDWPKGLYSRATFSLKRANGGTRVTFRPAGVPHGKYGSLKEGRISYSLESRKKQFQGLMARVPLGLPFSR